MSEGYDFPVAVNRKTGGRKQWNGSAWIDLPGANAPGGAYLPKAGNFAKDPSEAANFNKWRTDQETGVNNARTAMAQDREMEGLMTRQKTGGLLLNTPVVREAMTMFDPELRRMESLQSEAARSKRQPGEGTISDFDAKMFLQQVYGKGQPTETNQAIIRAGRLRSDAVMQKREMADWYYSTYGTRRGFDEAWDRYAQSNPIFDPSSEALGRPVLNQKRQNWRQYYGAVRGPGDERGSQAQEDVQRSQRAAVPDAARRAYERYGKEKGIDRSAKQGSARNPYLARDAGELSRIPAGSYAISPDGQFGYIK